MASFGPGDNFTQAEEIVKNQKGSEFLTPLELETEIASYKLEHSFIGILGKSIEPAIAPLGFDWKIGIALISSFAAREVFVGTLATIYSVGNTQEETLINRMKSERRPNGELLFDLPTGVSLMLFYAFALQCMSTLAIVKKETNSWKWPMIQLLTLPEQEVLRTLHIFSRSVFECFGQTNVI